ncbi:BadF/BadG/BcrA/BcrD ATPase family protein [Pisciglobus halotolerans]|uniref:BadF-type ATPase n=1 Tax=Pisciglobus halotolerans TaxID=745365 RepID=A0A1I3AXN8_9LACT|nr:BadF/BadG/BcrA/BcrD ATPase family protein [Pisciglobus halotolerans]SFH54762.1 BadF-type ATPase [Pisciglobus halotolerans]
MQYIIGIDSGGTSTEAAAYDKDGKALATAKTGFGNPLINKEKAIEHLEKAIEDIFKKLGRKNCSHIIFGLAGLDSGNFKEELEGHFQKYDSSITFLNDAWLAYFALLQNKEGILVISGTGSIAMGIKDGRKYRAGGWGNLLGDEGSAYAIALQMIKNSLIAYDKGKSSISFLNRELLNELHAKTIFEVVQFVYQHKKDEVAALAKVVVKAADQQDAEAIAILRSAGQDLALLVKELIEKMAFQNQLSIAVTGSVLEKNQIVFEQFFSNIKELPLEIEVIKKEVSNSIGAYYYLQSLAEGE